MPRVFIETTIPSFYFDTRADRRSRDWHAQTRTWWDDYRHRYELVTSPLVVAEFGRSPRNKADWAPAFFEGVAVLDLPARFEEVVRSYIESKVMPADAVGDAAHLAVASLHAADFLLTWNCRHLANSNKQRHIRVVNDRLALPTPIITTPFLLVPE